MDPTAGVDGYVKSRPHRNLNPAPSSPWRVAIPTELSRPVLKSLRILRLANSSWAVTFSNSDVSHFRNQRAKTNSNFRQNGLAIELITYEAVD